MHRVERQERRQSVPGEVRFGEGRTKSGRLTAACPENEYVAFRTKKSKMQRLYALIEKPGIGFSYFHKEVHVTEFFPHFRARISRTRGG